MTLGQSYYIMIGNKMGSFADSLKANVAEVKQEVNDKITNVAVSMFRDVVQGSPSQDLQDSEWATGWVINQWYPSTRAASSELNEQRDQVGLNSMDRIAQLIGTSNFIKKDNSLWLTNNVPYAYQVEALGWKGSIRMPYMMVGNALTKAKANL